MINLKEKISSVANSKEAKTVVGNFIWLSALQIAGYLFPLITMPYLAGVIGVEGYGKIAFAAAIMIWIQIFSEWGFNQTATRDVAQNRNNPEKVSEIFSNVLWARILLMFISLAIVLLLIAVIPKFKKEASVILVTFLLVPGHILFPDWFFQAIEKMRYISILNIVTKLVFTIAVFVFIKHPQDYILQPLFVSLGYCLSGCIALYFILYKWKIKISRPNFGTIFATIKQSTNIFINNIAPNLYNSFSQMLLGIIGGTTANGIYEGGNKLYNVSSSFLSVLTRTFFPFLSRHPEKHGVYVAITMSITIFVASVLFIFAPLVIRIMLSSEFVDSIIVVRILAVSLIFMMLYDCYGMCYLIIHKQEKILRQITLYVSILGIMISWILIKNYSYLGAAITVATCRSLLGITTFVAAKILDKKAITIYSQTKSI